MELATLSIKNRLQEALNEGDDSRMVGAWEIIRTDSTIMIHTNGVSYKCLIKNNKVIECDLVG